MQLGALEGDFDIGTTLPSLILQLEAVRVTYLRYRRAMPATIHPLHLVQIHAGYVAQIF